MALYLGLDLGTTALKAVVSDGASRIVAAASVPLRINHPKPSWSEQNPDDWWSAAVLACKKLRPQLAKVEAVSFSGQMHGLVLLDRALQPLRPAILWNDARAAGEAATLNTLDPKLADLAGVRAMASFFAPKLLWLQKHEPKQWRKIHCVMAPKDYLRLRMTGMAASDPVDASGMWLCDVAKRQWSPALAEACGVSLNILPPLLEAPALAGHMTADAARALGLKAGTPVMTGTGDAAASAIGLGVVGGNDGVISMGTAAQIIVSKQMHVPAPAQNIHAFCHGLPDRWFQMAALLNGASPLAWLAQTLGAKDISKLLQPIEPAMSKPCPVMFLPYLNGDRTPHDDPAARGAFVGLDHMSDRTVLARAVLEGVALSLSDCYDILKSTGTEPHRLLIIGGGAKSPLWTRIIASALGRELLVAEAGEYGAALGASRLARLGHTNEAVAKVCQFPKHVRRVKPVPRWAETYAAELPQFRALYQGLKSIRDTA